MIEEGRFIVYHNRGFCTVVNGKCDCDGHKGPCPYLKIMKRINKTRGDYLPVEKTRQCALSSEKVLFTTSKYVMTV